MGNADYSSRRTQIHAELALLDGFTDAPFDAERTEDELRSSLREWTGLAQPARQILRKLLPEKQRIRVRHDGGWTLPYDSRNARINPNCY